MRAVSARTDNLSAPPVRRGMDDDSPEVSPLATFGTRFQRGITGPEVSPPATFEAHLQRVIEKEE